MSAVIQQPYNPDPTLGMELTTGDEIALEATRWLFLAGDLLDPHRKDDLPHLAAGGEELANFCLRRTNGFVPRLAITPLEVWAEWLPIEYFPEGVRPMKLKGQDVKDENPTGQTLVGKPLFGYPHYPGELIVDAVGLSVSEKRGIVEIEALRTVPFGDSEVARIQQLFFPEDFRPLQLRKVEERIDQVAETNNSDIKWVAKDMQQSCAQFRRYAQAQIDRCHTQLDTRVSHQYTYSYSPKIRLFMQQLEVEPRQNAGQTLSAEVLKAVAGSGISNDALEAIMAKQGAMFAAAMTEAIKQAVAASQPSSE